MHWFYCVSRDIGRDSIVISDPAQLRHMKSALRLRVGESVTVFDERQTEYHAVVEAISRESVRLSIKGRAEASPGKSPARLAVACALPKNVKMDDIVDKLTQLGVDEIIPMRTQRVIVDWDVRKESSRRQRWERIAVSASEQSRRRSIPVIGAVLEFDRVLERVVQFDLALIPCLSGKRLPLKEALARNPRSSVLVMIGPEGDFSEREIAAAVSSGCVPVSLGDRVLRVDTACAAVAAFVRIYADG